VPRKRRPHDEPGYRARRRLLMKSITPHTRCWRCGKPAREHEQFHKSGRAARWQCGHTKDGDNTAPLALEWSTCNVGAGARLGHHRAFGQYRDNGGKRSSGPPAGWTPGPHLAQHYSDDPTSPGSAPCLAHSGELCPSCRAYHAKNP
jgi:hypothetical protein